MQIVKKNLKGGEVSIRVDSQEDLWYLHQLVADGDFISGKSERKIKLDRGGPDAKAAVVKKTVFMKILVERVEFHKHSDSLRILGVVEEGPEDVPRGSHHTIEVEPGTVITITKSEWAGYQLDKLKEASESVRHKILIVVFDREEAIFAMLKGQGQEILSKLKGEVSKKRLDTSEKKSFYSEIIKVLQEYVKRLNPDNIIVASPSFWKEYLMKETPDDLRKKITLATCSDVDENSFSEVMKRPEVQKILESDRAAKELSMIESLLQAVSKEIACYGIKDCEDQIKNGAVKELYASYSFLNKSRLSGNGKKTDGILRKCEEQGGKVHIISTNEAQEKLDGLGGIGGVLRWQTSK